VIGALSWSAYTEVRRATRDVAVERLTSVTSQFAQLLATSTGQVTTQVANQAKNPAVRAYLFEPKTGNPSAALNALAVAGSPAQQPASVELWDTAGKRLLARGDGVDRVDTALTRWVLARRGSDSARVGEFELVGDSIVYPAIAPIVNGRTTGYVVQWRFLRSTPQTRAQTNQLIGSNATLYLGNRDGVLWTDLGARVAPPPIAVDQLGGVVEYDRPNAGRRLAMARPIVGSAWVVLVEFGGGTVSAPARLFLVRESLIASVLAIVALMVGWFLSRRLTRPLRDVTLAAEGISAGDYSRRVPVTREDELGRLASAFNEMMQRVQDAQHGLEDRVNERTRELKQTLRQLQEGERRLSEAKDSAERANRAKSDFLAKMSHELRTPLNSIIGFSEVLQEQTFGPLNDKQERYVGNVLSSGRNLLDLINDILDLSKVEAGRMELAVDEFALSDALADIRTVVSALADRKSLEIQLDVDPALPRIVADQGKFKQIMYNLLSNAIKFTPDGGRVRVGARRGRSLSPDGPGMVEISVADTGIGIRPEDQQRIFQEFEQVTSEYGRDQPGTGLGLALTRRLVELHGGRLWVESEPGLGSRFSFTMPVSRERPVAAQPPDEAAARAGEQGAGDAPLVLVIEDDDRARELLTDQLRAAGYRTAEARSGAEALAAVAELKPEVITLDILLPDRHGHEVLAQLKSRPETRDIPVIVVSMTEDRQLGLSLGAADWFVKPARREDFIGAVHRAAASSGSARPATVLVIDDEPASVEFVTDLLVHQGFTVLAARGGREGVAKALEGRPNVIVLDLLMPEMSGFEVARRIRAAPEGAEIPIVVFSVKDLRNDERAMLEDMVQAIVMKGRGREALLREIEHLSARAPVGGFGG